MKPLSKMTTNELVDYWSGYLLIEIGRGTFREGVCHLLLSTMQETATRVRAEGKKGKNK